MRDDRKKEHRPLSRTECKAKLHVCLDPKTSKFKVVSFEKQQTYQKRFMWATAYLHDNFFAGIRTTSLCEGINSCIKSYLKRKNTIVELFYNFEHSLRDYRYNELLSDFNSFYTEPVLSTSLPLKIYTSDVFKLVKVEIVTAGSLNVVDTNDSGDKVTFTVDNYKHRQSLRNVVFDKDACKYECDCMMFESCGIPCSHIICVMRYQHVHVFPPSLICNRWLKDAKNSVYMSYETGDNSNDMIITTRFGVLSACFNRLGHLASKSPESFNFIRNEILKLTDKLQKEVGLQHNGYDASNDYCDPLVVKTKGAPSKKNVKKKSRKCSNCNLIGHVASTCPVLVSMDYDFSSSEDTIELDDAVDESVSYLF
uniref:Protein FAR1-RELATED SEQUENCE 5 n=1 Tax=Cajanus cajan TaxID=3821 RepID=A0A151RAB3_CAJCA|nr:Protein FAR1-RELATED SEQUENCE 5 [Cajanus cajan]